ncbi:MAG TPA: DUF4258 domain-containing protein [Ktedonobacterales bacterium]|jgi:hypothetical protein
MAGVRSAIRHGDRLVTAHAANEAVADHLFLDAIWASVIDQSAGVVEDYPNDPRGPSCLILSAINSRPIHTVVAYPAKRLAAQRQIPAVAVLITVYRPELRASEWSSDFRTRLPQP